MLSFEETDFPISGSNSSHKLEYLSNASPKFIKECKNASFIQLESSLELVLWTFSLCIVFERAIVFCYWSMLSQFLQLVFIVSDDIFIVRNLHLKYSLSRWWL